MKKPRNLVGPTVRKLRIQRAWSQPELAAVCQRFGWDVSRDIIAKIEDQRRWVSDAELCGLAHALNVNVAVLLPPKSIALARLKQTQS